MRQNSPVSRMEQARFQTIRAASRAVKLHDARDAPRRGEVQPVERRRVLDRVTARGLAGKGDHGALGRPSRRRVAGYGTARTRRSRPGSLQPIASRQVACFLPVGEHRAGRHSGFGRNLPDMLSGSGLGPELSGGGDRFAWRPWLCWCLFMRSRGKGSLARDTDRGLGDRSAFQQGRGQRRGDRHRRRSLNRRRLVTADRRRIGGVFHAMMASRFIHAAIRWQPGPRWPSAGSPQRRTTFPCGISPSRPTDIARPTPRSYSLADQFVNDHQTSEPSAARSSQVGFDGFRSRGSAVEPTGKVAQAQCRSGCRLPDH